MSYFGSVTISFEIDKDTLTHIEEKSCYNHNYYHIDTSWYGDYIIPAKCDTIYEECDDVSDGAYYSLGWFEGDEFIAAWTWYEDEAKL
jgi:hypothetical protein